MLTPAGLYFDGRLEPVDASSSLAVLRAAYRRERRQLWVGPGTAAALGWPAAFEVPEDGERYRYGMAHPWLQPALADGWTASTQPAGLAPWLTLNHGDIWLTIAVPGWDPSSPFHHVERPQHLLDALELFHRLLGVRYHRSPGTTGLALMKAVHAGGIQLPEAHLAPPALHDGELGAADHWLRVKAMPSSGWLHCWDLNGMYLAGCSSIELGFGTPAELRAPAPLPTWKPGYYLATVLGVLAAHRRRKPAIPPPFPLTLIGRPRWYAAPSLELAMELGFEVSVREAWVYPEAHRWLEPWYARIRDARKALLAEPSSPAVQLATKTLKLLYAHSLGRLAGSWLQEGDATFRPDWRDAVIARARANMYRHLQRVQVASGAIPVAANADAVVYASDLADPAAAASALGLEVSDQLGKWKLAGSLEARQACRLFRGVGSDQRKLLALMDAFGDLAA